MLGVQSTTELSWLVELLPDVVCSYIGTYGYNELGVILCCLRLCLICKVLAKTPKFIFRYDAVNSAL